MHEWVPTCNYATILASSHYTLYNLQWLYLYVTTYQIASPLCNLHTFSKQQLIYNKGLNSPTLNQTTPMGTSMQSYATILTFTLCILQFV
jgi:hypothetical protein